MVPSKEANRWQQELQISPITSRPCGRAASRQCHHRNQIASWVKSIPMGRSDCASGSSMNGIVFDGPRCRHETDCTDCRPRWARPSKASSALSGMVSSWSRAAGRSNRRVSWDAVVPPCGELNIRMTRFLLPRHAWRVTEAFALSMSGPEFLNELANRSGPNLKAQCQPVIKLSRTYSTHAPCPGDQMNRAVNIAYAQPFSNALPQCKSDVRKCLAERDACAERLGRQTTGARNGRPVGDPRLCGGYDSVSVVAGVVVRPPAARTCGGARHDGLRRPRVPAETFHQAPV